jgi:hypothetical protein
MCNPERDHGAVSRSGVPAAVDEERMAGDEVRCRAGEEYGGADEVRRLLESA